MARLPALRCPGRGVAPSPAALVAALVTALVTGSSLLAGPALAGSTSGGPVLNPYDGPVGGKRLVDTDRPVYQQNPDVQAPPKVSAGSYLVADLDSGKVLAAKNPHRRLRPASTLKMLTAVTLLPRLDKRARYTATRADANSVGSRVGVDPGETYAIDTLFYGLFLPSGNDAAHALAAASGGRRATVELMNSEARRLGAFDTHAVNASGLDPDDPDKKQLTSAYDLALIARAGMRRDDFREYVSTRTYDFPGRKGKTFQIQNTNRLLANYDGAIGIKNGYTSRARNTLVGAAERDGERLLVVVLRSDTSTWQQAARLLDWGFAHHGDAEPIGTLVTPEDVQRARQAEQRRTQPATRSERTSPGPTPAAGDDSSSPNPQAQPGSTLFDVNILWLGGAGVAFVVLASMRISAYVRSRRENP